MNIRVSNKLKNIILCQISKKLIIGTKGYICKGEK